MGFKDDDAQDACPESQGELERAELQLERDLNQAIADVQQYAARAEAAEKERDALFQRVQELKGAGRAACEVWERVPNASLHEIRETMKLLRKAVDAHLPSDQSEGVESYKTDGLYRPHLRKRQYKFNGGYGAVLCSNCSTIVCEGLGPDDDEREAKLVRDRYAQRRPDGRVYCRICAPPPPHAEAIFHSDRSEGEAARARLVAQELHRRGIRARYQRVQSHVCILIGGSGPRYWMHTDGRDLREPRTIADEIQHEEARRIRAWAGVDEELVES